MENEYDDSDRKRCCLKNGNIMVRIEDREGFADEGISRKIILQPSHLGSPRLSHSKRMMNDVILALYGCENKQIWYSYTDSVYIQNNDYEILKTKKLIGKDFN